MTIRITGLMALLCGLALAQTTQQLRVQTPEGRPARALVRYVDSYDPAWERSLPGDQQMWNLSAFTRQAGVALRRVAFGGWVLPEDRGNDALVFAYNQDSWGALRLDPNERGEVVLRMQPRRPFELRLRTPEGVPARSLPVAAYVPLDDGNVAPWCVWQATSDSRGVVRLDQVWDEFFGAAFGPFGYPLADTVHFSLGGLFAHQVSWTVKREQLRRGRILDLVVDQASYLDIGWSKPGFPEKSERPVARRPMRVVVEDLDTRWQVQGIPTLRRPLRLVVPADGRFVAVSANPIEGRTVPSVRAVELANEPMERRSVKLWADKVATVLEGRATTIDGTPYTGRALRFELTTQREGETITLAASPRQLANDGSFNLVLPEGILGGEVSYRAYPLGRRGNYERVATGIIPPMSAGDSRVLARDVVFLDRPKTLRGEVLDADGQPIIGVRLRLLDAEGETIASILSDVEGRFAIYGDQKEGSFDLALDKLGYRSETLRLNARYNEPLELRLERQGTALSGLLGGVR